jgi:hypothetical protein
LRFYEGVGVTVAVRVGILKIEELESDVLGTISTALVLTQLHFAWYVTRQLQDYN